MRYWAGYTVEVGSPRPMMAITLVAMLLGCGNRGIEMTGAQLKHDLNRPTNGDSASKWYEVQDEDLNSVVYPMYSMFQGGGEVKTLQADHPILKRVQHWLDVMDTNLRDRYPTELRHVPSPRAQVIVDSSPNAFVMPIPVCIDVPVWIDTSTEMTENNTVSSLGFSAQGAVIAPWNGNLCAQIDDDESFVHAYVRDFNSRQLDCQLEVRDVNGQTTLVVGESCEREPRVSVAAGSESLTIYPTASLVTIQSSIMNIMDEDAFVSVLGHELGHYYMSHADVSSPEKYDYFYKSGDMNHDHKPAAEEALEDVGQAAMSVKIANRRYRQTENQVYRSELYLPMLAMVQTIAAKQNCENETCNQACADLSVKSQSAEFKKAMGKFPFVKLPASSTKLFRQTERDIDSCLKAVVVGNEGQETGTSLSTFDLGYLLGMDRQISRYWEYTEIQDTVLSSIASAQESLLRVEKEVLEPLHEANRQQIGWYTTEQEADDLAVEWMGQIGISPVAVVDSEFALSLFVDEVYAQAGINRFPTEMDTPTCRALYNNNWKNSEGQYIFVPVGDFSDNHHSSCYRVWNADREIEAHSIEQEPVDHRPAGASWAEMQKMAKRLLNAPGEHHDISTFGGMVEDGLSEEWKEFFNGCQLFDAFRPS